MAIWREAERENRAERKTSYVPAALLYFYIWAITEKLIIKTSRGIWHVIGGWHKEKGSKKILRGRKSKGREGKDEPKHADW